MNRAQETPLTMSVPGSAPEGMPTMSTSQAAPAPAPESLEPAAPPLTGGVISVFLNSKRITLDATKDGSPHEFLELMALADIDISNPPESGRMILTLNGREASFMDPLRSGDRIVIKWDEK